jgi:hypothetical protein
MNDGLHRTFVDADGAVVARKRIDDEQAEKAVGLGERAGGA